jgi:UDPglucose 6-dehydrogenase
MLECSGTGNMRITIIGTGYVGLITGLCFCELGHQVICIDVVGEKVKAIQAGRAPLYEEGLQGLLDKHLSNGRFHASLDYDEVLRTDITFLCVGTPSRADGSMDLSYLETATRSLAEVLARKKGYHVVVVKSTVTPSITDKFVAPLLASCSGKKLPKEIGVATNPEFLREGSAVSDFMHPDRIVIGASDARAGNVVKMLYQSFRCPILEVSPTTAEMIKMASNVALATRISMINEIGNVCKELNIDVRQVAEGIGLDERIGKAFLNAGAGFGGSCFPKDVKGLLALADQMGIKPLLMKAVLDVNEIQPLRMIDLLEEHLGLDGKTIAVLGLAFKPDTDDVRESRSIVVVRSLLNKGAKVRAHDPQGMENFSKLFPNIEYAKSAKECVKNAHAVLIMTAWPEYSEEKLYGAKLVIDGRGVVKTKNYEGICW